MAFPPSSRLIGYWGEQPVTERICRMIFFILDLHETETYHDSVGFVFSARPLLYFKPFLEMIIFSSISKVIY